jgi:hypothetical protein
MPNVKISDLSAASTPLSGTEELPIVQSGTTVKATAQDVADLASSFAVENAGATPKITSNVFSSRPISDSVGSIYISTDTDEIYQYNGSNWDLLGGVVNTITSTTLTVDSTDPKNPIVDLGYKIFTAVITQSGTSAPTIDYTLVNTLGFTPTFAYVSPGIYTVSSTFAWTNNKTVVFLNPGFMPTGVGVDAGVALGWERNSSSQITLKSKKTSNDTDTNGLIFKATIEIRVYP